MFSLDRRQLLNRIIFYVALLLFSSKENTKPVNAFTFSSTSNSLSIHRSIHTKNPSFETRRLDALKQTQQDGEDISAKSEKSFVLTKEEVSPLIVLNKDNGKEKWINAYGLIFIVASIVTLPIWWVAMAVTDAVCNAFPDLDPNRAVYDKTGKIWSKIFLSMTNSYPDISGDLERLKDNNEQKACLYVANHASWLDIPVLCTVLDPVFKFIAKGELSGVICIGKQLKGGNHIMIDREDRRSQLRTFKEGVSWLKKGVPLMAFPEGKRSMDGKLMDFKGGIFSMAVRAQVPIVPVSVSNTHAIMPSNALLPVQSGAGKLHVHVHSPIDVEGKSEDELAELVRNALLSKMPLDQHPIAIEEETLTVGSEMHTHVQSHLPEIINIATKNQNKEHRISDTNNYDHNSKKLDLGKSSELQKN